MKQKLKLICKILFCILILNKTTAQAQDIKKGNSQAIEQGEKTIPVTWENFVRAETHKMFKNYAAIGRIWQVFPYPCCYTN